MATEIDHDQIKEKIVTILKANTTLFPAVKTLEAMRAITVGFPPGDPFDDQMFPYIFVVNASPFESIKNDGRAVVSNAITALIHTFHYNIVFVVNGKDARDTEEQLDDFQKTILQTLEADNDLSGVTTAEVDSQFPVIVDRFRGREDEEVQGRVITLMLIKTTS